MACTAAWQSPMTYRQLRARALRGATHLHDLVPGPFEVGPIPADASAPDDTAEQLGVDETDSLAARVTWTAWTLTEAGLLAASGSGRPGAHLVLEPAGFEDFLAFGDLRPHGRDGQAHRDEADCCELHVEGRLERGLTVCYGVHAGRAGWSDR